MIVYRPTDRIRIGFENKLVVVVSPLDQETRSRIAGMTRMEGGEEVQDNIGMAIESLRYGVKDVEGLENVSFADGSPFKLEFEENGRALTHETVDCLTQIFNSLKLGLIALKMVSGLYDFETISGVTMNPAGKVKKKVKRRG